MTINPKNAPNIPTLLGSGVGGLLLVQLPLVPIEYPEIQNRHFPSTSSSKHPVSIVALAFFVQTPLEKSYPALQIEQVNSEIILVSSQFGSIPCLLIHLVVSTLKAYVVWQSLQWLES